MFGMAEAGSLANYRGFLSQHGNKSPQHVASYGFASYVDMGFETLNSKCMCMSTLK